MKQYSILVIIKEMQMCTTIEYFETIIKIALKKIGNIKCRKDTTTKTFTFCWSECQIVLAL